MTTTRPHDPSDPTARRVGPAASEYAAAVARGAFVDPALRGATPRAGLLGLPASASGQQAVVFPLTTADGPVALRCFTSAPDARRARYRLLAEHLAARPCDALCGFRWVDEAIAVGGETWPGIVMPWVDGQRLDRAVEDRLGDPARLRALADAVVAAHRSLRTAGLAHGDLQHGNVLVLADGTVRLVDLDGVWAPALTDLRPGECGHPNYQHPDRVARGAWGEHVDTFSVLVLSVSLRGLAADPGLWRHHDGDNLVLGARDLRRAGDTPVWRELARALAGDAAVELEALRRLCRAPHAPDVALDVALDAARPAPTPVPPPATPTTAPAGGAWWAGMSRPTGPRPVASSARLAPIEPAPVATAHAATHAAAPSIVERVRTGDVGTLAAACGGSAAALVVLAAVYALTRLG